MDIITLRLTGRRRRMAERADRRGAGADAKIVARWTVRAVQKVFRTLPGPLAIEVRGPFPILADDGDHFIRDTVSWEGAVVPR